jgi:hypothetical protein
MGNAGQLGIKGGSLGTPSWRARCSLCKYPVPQDAAATSRSRAKACNQQEPAQAILQNRHLGQQSGLDGGSMPRSAPQQLMQHALESDAMVSHRTLNFADLARRPTISGNAQGRLQPHPRRPNRCAFFAQRLPGQPHLDGRSGLDGRRAAIREAAAHVFRADECVERGAVRLHLHTKVHVGFRPRECYD